MSVSKSRRVKIGNKRLSAIIHKSDRLSEEDVWVAIRIFTGMWGFGVWMIPVFMIPVKKTYIIAGDDAFIVATKKIFSTKIDAEVPLSAIGYMYVRRGFLGGRRFGLAIAGQLYEQNLDSRREKDLKRGFGDMLPVYSGKRKELRSAGIDTL